MSIKHALLPCFGFLIASAACAGNPLEADAPSDAQVEDLGDTLRTEVAGVQIRGTVGTWPGDTGVYKHVTPVHVSFINDSGHPLRINYEDIELEANNGESFHALPFYRMEGSVSKPVIVSDWNYNTLYSPGFAVPNYAASLYPSGVIIYEGFYDYTPGYYDTYYRYWADIELPTPEMVDRAMPEGVLSDGASLDGWVYFERVPKDKDLEPVYLSIELLDAETGDLLGRARLPFGID